MIDMKQKLIISITLLVMSFAALLANAQSHVIVAGDNVCLRSRASESYKMTGSLYPHFNTGDIFTCYGIEGNYYRVGWHNGIYYLPKKYGRPRGGNNNNAYSSSYTIIIAGDNVCLRSYPSESYKMTGSGNPHLSTGERYKCYGSVENYYKIDYYGNGSVYYIPKKYGRIR